MSFIKILSILIIISSVSSQQTTDSKPFLRIVAPKYICDDPSSNGNMTESTDDNKLTIGLQTRDGQQLNYSVSIDFTLLDGFQNQRHTLSIWKNIRELQAKFASKNISDEISLRNQIEIDALELTPQVVYTFKIIGYDDKNQASDEQNFTITYKGDQLKAIHSNVGEGVSLLLYGPETFYNDLEFLAVAEVLFCDPIYDYYYKWKIVGIVDEAFNADYLNVKGSVLKLPAGVLDGDKTYEFRVTIFNSNTESMASLSLPVKVQSKEIKTQNIPADCNVGVNREVPFVTALNRKSMTQDMNIKWMCSKEEAECPNVFTNSSENLRVSAIFPNEGEYSLSADVTVKGTTKSSNTKVLADPKVIPHVEIKYFPQQPVSVEDSNEFVATIMDLIPKCVAYWNIVVDEDFAKAKNENLTFTGMISITDYEEHFLQELVDYDNNTLSKDTTLEIPPNTLFPDSKYKFRLNILCPEPITDLNNTQDRKNVTTYFDIVFETNGPPRALPLLVLPFSGIPMKDEFVFKSGAAKERQSDYPLKYSFGYQVGNLSIKIGTFYEFQVARTQMPYADEILTFMQVTDNNNASVYVKGPKIKSNKPYNFTQNEISQKLAEVQGTLKRSEYSKTLNSATVLVLTQRQYGTAEDAKNYEEQIYQMLRSELESLKSIKSSTFVQQQNVIEFVKMIKNLLSIMTVFDEQFVEDILTLTESQSTRTKRMTLTNAMRNKSIMTLDSDYIKNVLSLSDILVSSSNKETAQREKKKYVEKIHFFIKSLCQDPYLNAHIIDSKFATFEVSKVYSRQIYMEQLRFPNDTATVMFSSNSNFPSKFICISKVKYNIDMFNESQNENTEEMVYETRILDDDPNGEKMFIKSENVGEQVVMEMPVRSGNANEQSCFIWKENRWSSKECEQQTVNQSKIICKCKTLKDSTIIKYQRSSKHEQVDTTTTPKIESTESTILQTTKESYQTTNIKEKITTLSASTTETTTYVTIKIETSIKKENFATEKSESATVQTNLPVEIKLTTIPSPSEKSSTSIFNSHKTTETTEKSDSKPTTTIPRITTNEMEIVPTTTSMSTTNKIFTENQITNTEKRESLQSTGLYSSTKEPATTAVSPKEMKTTMINSVSTDGIRQTTTGKVNNEKSKDVTESSEKNMKNELEQSMSSSKEQATTPVTTVIDTKESQQNSNSTRGTAQANFGLNIWFVAVMLCLFFGLILILIVLHRCRRFSDSYINLPMRHPSNNIKYAKYHDEFIMRG